MATPPERRSRQWWVLAGLLTVSVGLSQGLSWWNETRHAATVRQYAKAGDVTMYSTTDCPYCAKARSWLNEHGVPWHECHIDLDPGCMRTFQAQGAPGTPLMRVKGRWLLGFDAGQLAEALQAKPAIKVPAQPNQSGRDRLGQGGPGQLRPN